MKPCKVPLRVVKGHIGGGAGAEWDQIYSYLLTDKILNRNR